MPEPLARSPIAPAEPVTVVAGWQVSAVRAAGQELTLTDCTPLAKVALTARRAEICGVRSGAAPRGTRPAPSWSAPGQGNGC